ncbi:DNA repair protein RadC [candidate division KSB1 bacterium]|nr:DNA repair protein RadC [candidate division KSB1 bacterium]
MKRYTTTIKDWPEAERPRERLIKWGPDKLTDAELLAILLRVGGREDTAIGLARTLLNHFGGFQGIDSKSVAELCQLNGIGPAKAAQVKAALEIGKRFNTSSYQEKRKIESAEDVYNLLGPYLKNMEREVFKVVLLTSRNTLIAEKTIFEGSLTESLVNPREIVREALNAAAASIVFIHNHPSGDPAPSRDDKQITTRLINACQVVGINVLDHIIIATHGYFSFADEGLL